MSNDQFRLFVHNFAYFSLFFWKPVFLKIYLNKFKLHHLYMYLYLCVWINLYNNKILEKSVIFRMKFVILMFLNDYLKKSFMISLLKLNLELYKQHNIIYDTLYDLLTDLLTHNPIGVVRVGGGMFNFPLLKQIKLLQIFD